jgi:hypothetical protein
MTPHPKLDLRLAGLLELEHAALLPEGDGSSKRETGGRALRRSGPLAFLRGALAEGRPCDRRESSQSTTVPVFITARHAGVVEELMVPGMSLRATAGTMATAELPLGSLRALEANPEIVAIEWTGGAAPTSATDGGATRTAEVLPEEAVRS